MESDPELAEKRRGVLLSLCRARPGSSSSELLSTVIFSMKRTHTEASKTFVDPPLCSQCGQVEPASRYAARVNKKRAYWRDAHQHDIAGLVRVTVPENEIVAALRQKNSREIGAEVFPTSPSPSPSEALLALRYTLDLNELHHRHVGDLIDLIDAEIARATDSRKRCEALDLVSTLSLRLSSTMTPRRTPAPICRVRYLRFNRRFTRNSFVGSSNPCA